MFLVALRNTVIAFEFITMETEAESENYEFSFVRTWLISHEQNYVFRDVTQRTVIDTHQNTCCDTPKGIILQSHNRGSLETTLLYLHAVRTFGFMCI